MPSLVNHRLTSRFFVAALALAGITAHAQSNDLGRIETTLNAHEDYDSNIFLNSGQEDDYVSSASVKAKLARDSALLKSHVSVGATANLYKTHTELNSFDPAVEGGFDYDADKTIVTGLASFQRTSIANQDVNARVSSNNLNLSGTFQNLFSEKLGYRITANYSNSANLTTPALNNFNGQDLTDEFVDTYSYSGGLDAVYVYSPKLTVTFGYTHRESWTRNRNPNGGNPSSKDDRVAVGFEGDLAPKLTGTLRVGAERRKFRFSGFDDGSLLFVSSSLKWVPAEKTSVSLNLSQDFDTTAANQSVKMGSVSVLIAQTLTSQWGADAQVGYSHGNYQGFVSRHNTPFPGARTDNNWRVKGRVTYAIDTNVTLEASLGYGKVDSTIEFSSYNRTEIGVGLNASF